MFAYFNKREPAFGAALGALALTAAIFADAYMKSDFSNAFPLLAFVGAGAVACIAKKV